jgi:hypothetical protein
VHHYIDNNQQYLDDFFGEQGNVPDDPTPEEPFHQQNPRQDCRLTWGPGCRDHRCSVECRRRWSYRESSVLRRHLHAIPEGVSIYFGELVIADNVSGSEHKNIRKSFQTSLTAWGKDAQANVKLLAVAEVGGNLRMHYHYALTSTTIIGQDVIKNLWDEAAVGYRTIVSHSTPRSIDARARYMFKNMREPGNVRLLRKGSPRITWGHLDFYAPQGKTAIWKDHVDELKKLEKD